MKHIANKPELKDWTLDAIEELKAVFDKLALKAAAEALHCAFVDNEISIRFPAKWDKTDGIGNKNPAPLDVYLEVGVTPEIDYPAVYSFNLKECLQDAIADCTVDGSFSGGLARVSMALKDLAADIDRAIITGKENAKGERS